MNKRLLSLLLTSSIAVCMNYSVTTANASKNISQTTPPHPLAQSTNVTPSGNEFIQVKVSYTDVFSESELASLMKQINDKVDEFSMLMQEKNMSNADISEYSLAYRQQLCREMLLPKRESVCSEILRSIGISENSAYCSFEFTEICCSLTAEQLDKLKELDTVERITEISGMTSPEKYSYRLFEALNTDTAALTVMIKFEDVFSDAELKELNENINSAVEEYRQKLKSEDISDIEPKCFKYEQQLRKDMIYDKRCERVKGIMYNVGADFNADDYAGTAANLTCQLPIDQIKKLIENEYVTEIIWNEEDYNKGGPNVFTKTNGDANCDGMVNLADAVLIMQNLANPTKYPLTEQGITNADVIDNDGVTAKDALMIQRYTIGLEEKI